jgi:cytochrome b6-f complex iron-sulfur subunit
MQDTAMPATTLAATALAATTIDQPSKHAAPQGTELPRRQVLCGLLVLGAIGSTAGLLSACSSSDAPATPRAGAPAAGTVLAKVTDVPVGGGVLVSGGSGQILLSQPTAGTIVAFDPTCTHQGTTVGTPHSGVITCPNHGSRFKATDGSVVNGPAAAPLKTIAVKVSGGNVVTA